MIEFNKQLWRDRAWNRFKRAGCKGSSRAKRALAESQWFTDTVCIDKLVTVIEWCESKNINVSFGKTEGASYDAIGKTIKMAGRSRPEKQLYMLLHECGHHLIGFDEMDERFGMGYPFVEDPIVNVTFHHRIACLEEELEAWNRGWRLAKRLHLGLDRNAFDKVRLDCIRSYVKWTNGRSLMGT